MIALIPGGIRRIYFKDFFYESTKSNMPSVYWDSSDTTLWSVGVGNGSMPYSSPMGCGYRLIAAPNPGTSVAYTNLPANTWASVAQDNSEPKMYEFLMRYNDAVGEAGMYFMWDSASGSAYRLRVTSAGIYIDKSTSGLSGWTNIGSESVALSADTDYHIRIIYFPLDVSIGGNTADTGGRFLVTVDTARNKMGLGEVAMLSCRDTGSILTSGDRLGLFVGDNVDAEFGAITYASWFYPQLLGAHVITRLQNIGVSKAEFTFAKALDEEWDLLSIGDRIELWVKYPKTEQDASMEAYTIPDFDGVVQKVYQSDARDATIVVATDETQELAYSGDSKTYNPTVGTYYDIILAQFIGEYHGSIYAPAFSRLSARPGINPSVSWGTPSSSWTDDADNLEQLKVLGWLNNVWWFWNPEGFLLGTQNPIVYPSSTSPLVIDTYSTTNILMVRAVVDVHDGDQIKNSITVEHASGTVNATDATSISSIGKRDRRIYAKNMPSSDANTLATNMLNSQLKEKVYDVYSFIDLIDLRPGYGVKVKLKEAGDSSEVEMIVTEKEYWGGDVSGKTPAGIIRIRLAEYPFSSPSSLPKMLYDKDDMIYDVLKTLQNDRRFL
mgnify:CR=1 FL=1